MDKTQNSAVAFLLSPDSTCSLFYPWISPTINAFQWVAFIDAVRNVFGILGILMGNYTQIIFIRLWVHTRLYRMGMIPSPSKIHIILGTGK